MQKGNSEAFEELVIEYQKNVYNLALRIIGNPDDAADITQEAFIKAFNSLSSFRGECKFSAWMYRIVSNVCLDFLRAKKRRNEVSLSAENDDGEESQIDIPDESLSPEAILENELTRETIQKGLLSLPSDYRRILLLREVQGMTYEDISAALSLELGTVKSRIFRARKKLCAFILKDGNYPDFVSSCNTEGGESHE